ncbi:hypothetical protein Ahy_B07g087469 [Arachis hypogaea]|uniref:RNase H type-1 domain-containing protein n=1 Tax=Arachis hypogaea TaxID=3818 RepID=A0A444YC85_ARAHY|nr:hypothetical protein Ahy_B07g087469 [Arachis hypogaea]
MPISLLRSEDRLIWSFRWDGDYTIKTGYHVAKKEKQDREEAGPSTSTDMADLWMEIWRMEKIKTTEHAILLCPWTRATWFGTQIQCLPLPETVKSFAESLLEMCRKIRREGREETDDLIGRVGVLSWEIWKMRNQTIFQNTKPNPKGLPSCGFTWVPREKNELADGVAKFFLIGQLEKNWRWKPLREIVEQLRREATN